MDVRVGRLQFFYLFGIFKGLVILFFLSGYLHAESSWLDIVRLHFDGHSEFLLRVFVLRLKGIRVISHVIKTKLFRLIYHSLFTYQLCEADASVVVEYGEVCYFFGRAKFDGLLVKSKALVIALLFEFLIRFFL